MVTPTVVSTRSVLASYNFENEPCLASGSQIYLIGFFLAQGRKGHEVGRALVWKCTAGASNCETKSSVAVGNIETLNLC